jgi:hypothetical protein
VTAIAELKAEVNANWPNIAAANLNATTMLAQLTEAVKETTASDTSIVIFGSLGRYELTPGSDIGWTLLLDGPSDPHHYPTSQKIAKAIKDLAPKDIGKEGTFGTLVSSHDLVNYIGGEGDTNANTTRRNLLLLESRCVGNDEAYKRVKRNLLKRYLSEDSGLWRPEVKSKLPHFLLNDIARYWRTMTVDYAYKDRTRGGAGIPLRNIKLGLSRKLIYVAGLLACYTCHLDFADDDAREAFYAEQNSAGLVAKLDKTLEMPPLELTASVLSRFPEHQKQAKALFDAYDHFLGMLLNEDVRKHLEALHSDQCNADSVYLEAKDVRREFMRAIETIFLEKTSILGTFTIRYGFLMREIGFSTGAIALDDFRTAIDQLASHATRAIELSALRVHELRPLVDALPQLDLSAYTYISMHLPSSFSAEEEIELVDLLAAVPEHWYLVVHPDSIHDASLWRSLASRVAIENMDRRKTCGRTAQELCAWFEKLPEAALCFDIGHARQFDPSMAEAWLILTAFRDRLVQLHVSEVDAQSRHAVITCAAEMAFREVAHLIPPGIPLILESRVSEAQIETELAKAADLFRHS